MCLGEQQPTIECAYGGQSDAKGPLPTLYSWHNFLRLVTLSSNQVEQKELTHACSSGSSTAAGLAYSAQAAPAAPGAHLQFQVVLHGRRAEITAWPS